MYSQTASLQSHLDFYLPPCTMCSTRSLTFTPELLKIFYIARVLFSQSSTHRIKTQAAPLLGRQQIFSSRSGETGVETEASKQAPMDNAINLAKIRSTSDIARLLPREHVLYSENMFYKKLGNRDLTKIDYETHTAAVTSVDRFLGSETADLLRSQKVYLLFDNSTSMNGERFKKLFVSKAIAIEYLRRVCREEPQIYFRPFHSEVGDLVKATSRRGIHALIEHIIGLGTGGGRITNIGTAVVQAVEDISTDPELREAEILVMTDGFGPIPKNLSEQLGTIKLHVILIPDLDIEKILTLYPSRKEWVAGGPDGTRPMPSFWKYHSSTPPPAVLDGDELYQETYRSYKTASKSVKELNTLEILQGLNQLYMLQEVCHNFIFIVISSVLGETFTCSLDDIEEIAEHIRTMQQQNFDAMTTDGKLQFLQAVQFLIEFLTVARSNSDDTAVKKRIQQCARELEALRARILADEWIQSMLKTDNISFGVTLDMAGTLDKKEETSLFAAFAFLFKFLWDKLCENFRKIRQDYKI